MRCNAPCECTGDDHEPKLVVVTGGPGAGKTAVLEMARRSLCRHVMILPESAGIVFGGGFPRHDAEYARRAAQRAIFHVQREMERLFLEERSAAVVLCDRGTLDGLGYWPGTPADYFDQIGSDQATELGRYAAVIHLRSPGLELGYDHSNPLRIETADEAATIDARIEVAWRDHPRRTIIGSETDFVTKAHAALAAINGELPDCCNALRL